ncbi:muscle M-line assembly protein unc-89-like [Trichosurus vulpecula]|uniref:muscle M-line assembly protein unc-89-like n=1 Tax=Trichosurus vulpecula TaxID=9337 RepID=UPI00186B461C|nr:muscle M-line assembly protein unc-89-like [Trichosurus vulpecula]
MREAFSDSEDCLGHSLVAAKRYAKRTSSTSSWPENFKPSFTQKLTFKYVLEGEPVVFQCKLIACPTPKITWFHNNRPISTSLRRVIKTENYLHNHSSSLEVKNVQNRDSGSYRLFAINSEGSAESTASLLVVQREQGGKYLEFFKRAEKTCESIEGLAEGTIEDRVKVDLRFIGSPFNKKQDVEHRGIRRTIHFKKTIPAKRKDFMYNEDYFESKSEVQEWFNVGESFLDEETKIKLQRLREAKRILMEKKKLPSLDTSSELGTRILRDEASDKDNVSSREIRSIPISYLDRNKDYVDDSTEESGEFQSHLDKNLMSGEPPKSPQATFEGTINEEIFQTNIMIQDAFPRESFQEDSKISARTDSITDSFHSKETFIEDTQRVEEFEVFMRENITQESSGCISIGHMNEEVCPIDPNNPITSDVIASYTSESFATSENTEKIIEVDKQGDLAQVKHPVSMKNDESQIEVEETAARYESPFQKRLQRCPPSFIYELESQEVNEGDCCMFACYFQGYPQPIVTWYNNDMPIPRRQDYIIQTTEGHSMLTFSSVLPQNEGSVTCVLFNQYGTVKTSGMIKVKAKQSFGVKPHNTCQVPSFQEYTEEEEELPLAFNPMKEGSQTFWQEDKPNVSISEVNPSSSTTADLELLSFPVEIQITAATLTPKQEEFREVFQPVEFVASHDQVTQSPKHRFAFSFSESPKLLAEMPKLIKCREGDSVTFECLISGDPQPTVTWYQHGTALKQSQRFGFEEEDGRYRLCINEVSSQDSGRYICIAENNSGIVESVSDLIVEPVSLSSYKQLENIGDIEMKHFTNRQEKMQEEIAKVHFYDYSVDSLTSKSNVKEYSVKEYFQSLETVQQLQEKDKEHCVYSKEKPARFMRGVTKSVIIHEPPRVENANLQCQSKRKDRSVSEQTESEKGKARAYPFKIEKQFDKQEEIQKENIYEHRTAEYLSNIQLERTIQSYVEKDSSIMVSEEPCNRKRHYVGEKVKEEGQGQPLEKVVREEYGFRSATSEVSDACYEGPARTPSELLESESYAPLVGEITDVRTYIKDEVDSHNFAMNLKLLSSQAGQNFAEKEKERGKESCLEDQSPASESAEPGRYIRSDLKQSHSHVEDVEDGSQELDKVDPEVVEDQEAASEINKPDLESIVFDLKQIYSHLGNTTKELEEQVCEQQKEIYYEDEIPNSEALKSDVCDISKNVQNATLLTEQEIPSSQEISSGHVIELEKRSIHEDTLYLEKEGPYLQVHDFSVLETDFSLKSRAEETHHETLPWFQTLVPEMPETGDENFIADLKKAASEGRHLITSEIEEKEGHILVPESTSFEKLDVRMKNYEGVTPEEHNDDRNETDTHHRKPSVSQRFPFLITEEHLDQNEQAAENPDGFKEEKCYVENQTEKEMPSPTNETFNITQSKTCLSENTSNLNEAHSTETVESETSLAKYLLSAGKQKLPDTKDIEAGLFQTESISSMEVEDVTFNTVYEFYNQQQESLARPFSPESEMSIEFGSTSSEEISELDQFYTPPSSVEHFESPVSHELHFTSLDTTEKYSTPVGGEIAERYSTSSEGEVAERYATPSGGESAERYSTPSGGESAERYSTPSGGESAERYSTPSGGESAERYSTPSGGESAERFSTPSGEETIERYSTPLGGPKLNLNMKKFPSKIAREDSTPNELYHTPTGERSPASDLWRSESFGTPNEAVEPKENEMPPSFISPLTKRRIFENTTLGFIVEVEGLPIPGVKWYRNKSLLEPDERIKIERVGNVCSLEICNIQKSDEGEYMCHAVNIIGEAKSFAKVDILPPDRRAVALPPPVIHQHIMEFDLEKSSSSRTPSPQEIVLEVELGENDVKEFEKQVKIVTVPEFTSDHKSMIVSLDVLPLNLVEPNMAFMGNENRDLKIDLEVFEMPPRFTKPICDYKIPEDSEAVFECSVIGVPTPVIRWYKEYTYIEPDDVKYVVTDEKGNHSLKILGVCLSDSATYRCRAVNNVGEAICRGSLTIGNSEIVATTSRKSKVTVSSFKEKSVLKSKYSDRFFEFHVVEGPPRFVKAISDCSSPVGTAAYFQCLVRGSPKPMVNWYKDGKLVQGNRFSSEESDTGFHNLFITSLIPTDEGEYRCVATNQLGMAETCATLTLTKFC